MPKRTVAACALGLILAGAAYAQAARAPGEADRLRVAVLGFSRDTAHVGLWAVMDLGDPLRDRIERQLMHGRGFTVVGLRRPPELGIENVTDPAETLAAAGGGLGADLVLYGTVERLAVQAVAFAVWRNGRRLERMAGTTLMQAWLLDVAAGKITWADSFEVERLSPERSAQRMADGLLDELAAQVAGAAAEHIELIAVPGAAASEPVVDGDGDGDGIPDYLNRRANPEDSNRDGLPDYLNRYFLQRRLRRMPSRLRRTGTSSPYGTT